MLVIAYRRKRERSIGLATIEFDTETGRSVRRNRHGKDLDNGVDISGGNWTKERFCNWACVQYPNDWSLNPSDAWWVSKYLKMDEGL